MAESRNPVLDGTGFLMLCTHAASFVGQMQISNPGIRDWQFGYVSAGMPILGMCHQRAVSMVLPSRYESLGAEGYHSLFSWYQRFEAQHFPDPMGIRDTITRWTGHLYPSVLKFSFAVFDVPEAIAVSRTALCSAHPLTRLQARQSCRVAILCFPADTGSASPAAAGQIASAIPWRACCSRAPPGSAAWC